MKKGWPEIFQKYPDYLNKIQFAEFRTNIFSMLGYSTCSEENLKGRAIWLAEIENDLFIKWQICSDREENLRKFFGKLF